MSRTLVLIAAVALATGVSAQTPAPAQPSAPAAAPAAAAPAAPAKEAASGNVAVVNGTAIKRSEVDMIVRQLNRPDSPEIRKAITDKLIEFEVLTQEAKRRKLLQREDVKFQVENASRQALIQALLRDELETHKISEEELKAEYDRTLSAGAGDKEYKAHHILVSTEQEAKDIIAKLDSGAKFEDLAKASKDGGSAANGGALDWSPASGYVKAFSDAMVKLEKGTYTKTPVQTQYGWHVIRLDDTRPVTPPTFEQVKQRLAESLQQKRIREFIDGLVKKATIK